MKFSYKRQIKNSIDIGQARGREEREKERGKRERERGKREGETRYFSRASH